MRRALITGLALLLAGCDPLPNEGAGLALRIDRASQSAPGTAYSLILDGAVVNTGDRDYTARSCTRPDIAIDSLGAGQWVPMETLQAEELITCVRAYTVTGGTTATFTTVITRARTGTAFPTRVLLRARLVDGQSLTGPSAEFSLQR